MFSHEHDGKRSHHLLADVIVSIPFPIHAMERQILFSTNHHLSDSHKQFVRQLNTRTIFHSQQIIRKIASSSKEQAGNLLADTNKDAHAFIYINVGHDRSEFHVQLRHVRESGWEGGRGGRERE